jgi:hypothetical protein
MFLLRVSVGKLGHGRGLRQRMHTASMLWFRCIRSMAANDRRLWWWVLHGAARDIALHGDSLRFCAHQTAGLLAEFMWVVEGRLRSI